METLFLSGFGVSLKIKNSSLVITDGKNNFEGPKRTIEITKHANFDKIVIDGEGWISFGALKWLTDWDIQVIMIDTKGRLYAHFNQFNGINAEPNLRQKQYDCFRDEKKVEYLRKWIVSEKIRSQTQTLLSLNDSNVESVERLQRYLIELEDAHKLTEISPIESTAANVYYQVFCKAFNPKFGFTTRQNPMTQRADRATDIINLLLNYGYSILQSTVGKYLNGWGLDCYYGFYHRHNTTRSSLTWDMMDPYRYLVDRSVLEFQRQIKNDDYYVRRTKAPYPFQKAGTQVLLYATSDVKKRYVHTLSDILQRKVKYKSYRGRSAGKELDEAGTGYQKMRNSTIIKMGTLKLRNYILNGDRKVMLTPIAR